MPLIKLQTSVECSREQKEKLTGKLSALCAEKIGKPETFVAALVEDDAVISFGGSQAEAAFVEVRSIGGLNGSVNKSLSSGVCSILEAEIGIRPDRVYINFIDVSAADWGWNSSTFG